MQNELEIFDGFALCGKQFFVVCLDGGNIFMVGAVINIMRRIK